MLGASKLKIEQVEKIKQLILILMKVKDILKELLKITQKN